MQKRRRLGQHYLIDPSVIGRMIDASAITTGERVLEIGTGTGVLTGRLCELSDHVEAFELDETNFHATKSLGFKNLRLHLGDAFEARPEFDILVSSLPYSESSNFIEWLSQSSYSRAVVLLQKDFVEKLISAPGDNRYRAISVISQLSTVIKILHEVDRSSFDPPPRITSVIVEIKPRTVLSQRQIRLVKILFSQKRRKLSVALRNLKLRSGSIRADLLERRVQGLSPSEFASMFDGNL